MVNGSGLKMRDGDRSILEIGASLYTCKKDCTFAAILPVDARTAKEKLEQHIERVSRWVNVSCRVRVFRTM